MKQRIHTIVLCLATAISQIMGASAVHAATVPDHIVILALQTGQTAAAGNDFAEIYNPTGSDVDVTGWKLQYRAATAVGTATWTTKRTIACVTAATGCTVVLPAHGHLVFSTYDLPTVADEQTISSGFSDVGGELRLAQTVGTATVVQDMVGYGTAAEFEGAVAAAPAPDTTLVRVTDAGEVVDTNNNATDFVVINAGCYGVGGTVDGPVNNLCATSAPIDPEPTPDPVPPVDPAPEPTPDPQPVPDPDPTPVPAPVVDLPADPGPMVDPIPVTYSPLVITELLPDPLPPQKDDADEFIELYNPGSEPVNAAGYTIKAGSNFQYKYVLGNVTVAPGAYATFTSSTTNIPLSNSGVPVELLDPAGGILDTVASYGTAKPGQAWAKTDSGWQWTITPTPSAANTITAPLTKTETKASKTAAKTTKKKAAVVAKVAGAKTLKPLLPGAGSQETSVDMPDEPFNYWLLAPVGILVFGYVLYEYRQNIVRMFRSRQEVTASQTTQQTD